MFRVFTYRKSYKYDDVLQSLVKSYNNSKHRSIGMAPSKANKPFRRGYLPDWSDEVFTVAKVYHSYPTTYKLQDMKAEAIKGRFYAEELQKISKRSDDYWHVEKVLKTKGSGRKKEYYVKWKGFDNRFNSWVKAAWMK
ncbi:chromo domain-containing protein [Trichonephila clavata]|uniref:Chromo domain-containing protein n=1 Tax=Trichonephila clavata TaxID=2740835 RepID=A0A8X6G449_TRICU|nr:chromo domain-containing protein [Trichonephila clavata]